jgi:hypothetical protein
MLEQKIEELILAVKALTKAIGSTYEPVERPKVTAAEVSAERDANGGTMMAAKERVLKAKEEVPNVIAEEAKKSQTTSSTSQTSSPESAPVTYDDVKKATNAVSGKFGRDAALAGLQRFGVTGAMKLTEAQWPEYVAYMTRVATGEIEPEASHE